MRTAELKCGDRVLVSRCHLAKDFVSRFLGLMGRKSLPGDEAILFPKCNSIHTFFMRFPIDVLLVSDGGEVVDVVESIRPWRLILPRRGVRHVVEMAPNRCRELGVARGTRLHFPGVWE